MTVEMLQIVGWSWTWAFGIWIGLCIGYEMWGRKREISEPITLQESLLQRRK